MEELGDLWISPELPDSIYGDSPPSEDLEYNAEILTDMEDEDIKKPIEINFGSCTSELHKLDCTTSLPVGEKVEDVLPRGAVNSSLLVTQSSEKKVAHFEINRDAEMDIESSDEIQTQKVFLLDNNLHSNKKLVSYFIDANNELQDKIFDTEELDSDLTHNRKGYHEALTGKGRDELRMKGITWFDFDQREKEKHNDLITCRVMENCFPKSTPMKWNNHSINNLEYPKTGNTNQKISSPTTEKQYISIESSKIIPEYQHSGICSLSDHLKLFSVSKTMQQFNCKDINFNYSQFIKSVSGRKITFSDFYRNQMNIMQTFVSNYTKQHALQPFNEKQLQGQSISNLLNNDAETIICNTAPEYNKKQNIIDKTLKDILKQNNAFLTLFQMKDLTDNTKIITSRNNCMYRNDLSSISLPIEVCGYYNSALKSMGNSQLLYTQNLSNNQTTKVSVKIAHTLFMDHLYITAPNILFIKNILNSLPHTIRSLFFFKLTSKQNFPNFKPFKFLKKYISVKNKSLLHSTSSRTTKPLGKTLVESLRNIRGTKTEDKQGCRNDVTNKIFTANLTSPGTSGNQIYLFCTGEDTFQLVNTDNAQVTHNPCDVDIVEESCEKQNMKHEFTSADYQEKAEFVEERENFSISENSCHNRDEVELDNTNHCLETKEKYKQFGNKVKIYEDEELIKLVDDEVDFCLQNFEKTYNRSTKSKMIQTNISIKPEDSNMTSEEMFLKKTDSDYKKKSKKRNIEALCLEYFIPQKQRKINVVSESLENSVPNLKLVKTDRSEANENEKNQIVPDSCANYVSDENETAELYGTAKQLKEIPKICSQFIWKYDPTMHKSISEKDLNGMNESETRNIRRPIRLGLSKRLKPNRLHNNTF